MVDQNTVKKSIMEDMKDLIRENGVESLSAIEICERKL